ncbi:MAG: tetratricopeptide repeat protein [Planctomycetota bacterium]|nr:tetratricopeptide repeat protein [Planctomycetota bacterium]
MPFGKLIAAAGLLVVAHLVPPQAGPFAPDVAPEDVLGVFTPGGPYGRLTVLYPFDEAVFPPEFPAPTFRWDDPQDRVNTWVIAVDFEGGGRLTARVHAEAWKPTDDQWAEIKRRSVDKKAQVTVLGVQDLTPRHIITAGSVSISTSRDEVGAPIFYRDVPLPFADAVKDPSRIRWRFGLVSSKEMPRIVLEKLPVCGNCHSFSADGSVLGMDIDYANDKGSYAIAPVTSEIVLDKDKIITWSDYRSEDKELTFGLLSQMSPDGRYAVSTVKDRSVFVAMPDLAFSQLFFPLQGILAFYDRTTGRFAALPGADDRSLVQSNPSWSPDGKTLFFARAKARKLANLRNKDMALLTTEDCKEFTEGGEIFQYDVYRIPFADGKGGTAEPLRGASANGKSNYFPKCSPDGKWVVFCRARSFMLLQADSELYIVASSGGEARRMRCNTARMNSWHSWSPNGRWLVFSSKAFSPYTQLFLTHIDADGRDTPPVLLENFTPPDRAANIPEFVNLAPERIASIRERFVDELSFLRAGMLCLDARDYAGAAQSFRKAIEVNPRYAIAYVKLSMALAARGNSDEAIAQARKAIEIDPNLAEAHFNLSGFLAAKGRLAEALPECLEAARLAPTQSDVQSRAGALLLAAGKPEEAIDRLKEAVRLGTTDPTAYYNLAQVLCSKGQYAEAIPYYEEVLRQQPRHTSALSNLAIALARSGRTDEAIARLSEAIQVKATSRRLQLLAQLLRSQGRHEDAAKAAAMAAKLSAAEKGRPPGPAPGSPPGSD